MDYSLLNYQRKKMHIVESKIKGNFILTEKANQRLELINNLLISNIPIMLVGPTGTSKTKSLLVWCEINNKSDKLIRFNPSAETTTEDLMGRLISDYDSFSGFIFKPGPFIEAFSEGKIFLMDEINLAPKYVLESLQSALDSGEINQELQGSKRKKFLMHKDFRFVATLNPNSSKYKREELTNRFLQRFQIIEFPPFKYEELKIIAREIANINLYTNNNIIDEISKFHFEWTSTSESKTSPQVFTIRDLSTTIKAISQKKYEPFDAINCFYSSRYEINERKVLLNLLKQNFNRIYKNYSFPNLPNDFPECFENNCLRKVFHFSKIAIDNEKHILFTGKQGSGLTQIAKWISNYFSNSKEKDDDFLFVLTPESTVADLIGRYIPLPKIENNIDIIKWNDGPLTKAIRNGNSGVLVNLNSAQSKVTERLNGLLDPKDVEEDYFFDIPENSKEPKIKIDKNFRLYATCDINYLSQISPALLNRFNVIVIDNQLELTTLSDINKLVYIIMKKDLESYQKKKYNKNNDLNIPKELVQNISQLYINNSMTMSNIARLSKSAIRLYKRFPKCPIIKLFKYVQDLLGKNNNIEIPDEIEEEVKKILTTNKQFLNDEKFYFINSKNLVNLMINIYCCSIIRVGVCLQGPTGLGKTSMARALSEIVIGQNLDKPPYIMYSFHMETTLDDLFGTYSFENGKPIIVKRPLYISLEKGINFIADEFNLSEDSILQSISCILESSDIGTRVLIPGIGKSVKYNPGFFFIACQNDISTSARKKLPINIEKRLKLFEYPMPDEKDIQTSCEELIKTEFETNFSVSFSIKISKFMFLLIKNNIPEIGLWSMRNIRKIFRRLLRQEENKNEYINIEPIHQLIIFILGSIQQKKRIEIFNKILPLLESSFQFNKKEEDSLIKFVNSKITLETINNKLYLLKNNSGIIIPPSFKNISINLYSFWEAAFYSLFSHYKETLLFCGETGFKNFLAQKIAPEAHIIHINQETSIAQLIGYVSLTDKMQEKEYILELIIKMCHEGNFESLRKDLQNYLYYHKNKKLIKEIKKSKKEEDDYSDDENKKNVDNSSSNEEKQCQKKI